MASYDIIVKLVDQTKASMRSIETGLTSIQSRAEQVNKTLDKLGTGLEKSAKIASAALTAAAVSAVHFADSISDTSKATEMSVSSIIGLTKAIEVSGGNAEKATQMFLNFSRTVGEAADGSRSAYDALDKLGISGAQLRTLNMDQLFALATKNLAEMGDAAKAAAAALPAMGRGAKGIDFGASPAGAKGTFTQTNYANTNNISVTYSPWDPVAQTFIVSKDNYPNGMFLASVDLFFMAKDDSNLPVTVQIRPTVNGAPSTDYWYPESVVTKYPSEINVSESPNISNSSTYTKFTFDYPVYLKPGLYAFVIITDSPEYTVWEAEKGGTTTNNEFVDKQPYMGTLYKSQNTMEYVPFLNEDLMFTLNRCVFSTSSARFSLENEAQDVTYNVDKFRLIETSIIPSDSITTLKHTLATTTSLGAKEIGRAHVCTPVTATSRMPSSA